MSTLYQDIFDVQKINPEGKKFEKVNRLLCKGLTNDVQLLIDINCDIGFKVHEGDKISVAFASSLAMDGSLDDGTYKMYTDEPTLLDQYEYAMHGKLYKWKQDQPKAPVEIYVSFGGLLMRLKGDARHLAKLSLDSRVYALFRRNPN